MLDFVIQMSIIKVSMSAAKATPIKTVTKDLEKNPKRKEIITATGLVSLLKKTPI